MAIVRWFDPFKDLSVMQERMNRLFEDTYSRFRGKDEILKKGVWSPSMDIYETEEKIIVNAELPGVDKESITLEVKDGVLAIRGERKFEKDVKEENYHLMEREYGTFARSFSLPATIDQDKVSASYRDGILEIILPKKDEVKPKHIKIEVS